ncbi:MAG: hypothetical protein M0Z43_11260 [Acidithiobacillus sp.]|nr:hypothetical protein [Acidithiobacillus sp.]
MRLPTNRQPVNRLPVARQGVTRQSLSSSPDIVPWYYFSGASAGSPPSAAVTFQADPLQTLTAQVKTRHHRFVNPHGGACPAQEEAWVNDGTIANTGVNPGTGAIAGLNNWLYDVGDEDDSYTVLSRIPGIANSVLHANPLAPCTYDALFLRAIIGDVIYFGTCRPEAGFLTLSHEYKMDVNTLALTDLGTIAGHAAFQSVTSAGVIYAVGQSGFDAVTLRASITTIDTATDTVTDTMIPGTVDADELQSVIDDGTDLIVIGNGTLWVVPKATVTNPATYTSYVVPMSGTKMNLIKIGTDYYALAAQLYKKGATWADWNVINIPGAAYNYGASAYYDGTTLYVVTSEDAGFPYRKTISMATFPGGVLTWATPLLLTPNIPADYRDAMMTSLPRLHKNSAGELLMIYSHAYGDADATNRHEIFRINEITGGMEMLEWDLPGTVPINSGVVNHGTDVIYSTLSLGRIRKAVMP